jgi:hypothetical protein
VDHRRCQRARGGPHERRHRDESTPTANSPQWLVSGRMTSLTHAVLVLLAPVAAAALIGLYWGYQASKLSWPERPPEEDKPLVCCLSSPGALSCARRELATLGDCVP